MNKESTLFKELNISVKTDAISGPLDIDIQAVRQRVNEKLTSACQERKSITMKSKKKILLIAIAATLALGITAFSASRLVSSWYSSSSAAPDYKKLPTAQQVTKDIGYTPVLIDTFKNGYAFKNGSIVNNSLEDESGTSVEKFKSVSFDYEKDSDTVIFAQDKFNSETELPGDIVKTVKDTDIYYYAYINKVVPADYKLTDADKKAEENGELVFSYGSDEIKIQKVQFVMWYKDGIQYQLLQMDGKLSANELADMAEEIVNSL